MTRSELIEVFREISEKGTAPLHLCRELGVGYDAGFQKLRELYLHDAFASGRSSHKIVCGPYGSGKTHFLRQLLAIASEENCFTAEVSLNSELDFTKRLSVYREVIRVLRAPSSDSYGAEGLLQACFAKLEEEASSLGGGGSRELLKARIDAFDHTRAESRDFARIARRGLTALLDHDPALFDNCATWISGLVEDARLARELQVSRVGRAESDRFARLALRSIAQLIQFCGFRGTVLAFDEAEQSFDRVTQKKFQDIQSMLMSEINDPHQSRYSGVLYVYALTPDVLERLREFSALAQRLEDAIPGRTFWENPRSMVIPLARESGQGLEQDLIAIGERYIDVFLHDRPDDAETRMRLREIARDVATRVSSRDPSLSSRRKFAKKLATILVAGEESGVFEDFGVVVEEEEPPE